MINVLGPLVAHFHLGGARSWGFIVAAYSTGAAADGMAMIKFRPRRILVAGTLSVPAFSLPLALADPLPVPLDVAVAAPDSCNQVASSFGLGPAQFTSYHPSPLTGATWDWWAWVRP
jgi:hypothetical protein